MKLAIAIAAENAAPSAFVVWRGFAQAIGKAKEYGYQGVELALRSAQEYKDENLSSILKKNDMSVSCISTGQVFATDGLYFTHRDAAVRKKTIETFSGLIRIAGELGAAVNVGRARGSIQDGWSREDTENLFCDGLYSLLPVLEECGTDLVIEPVNRYEINYLNTVDEVCDLLRKLNSKRFGVMPDVFHMNIEDDDICKSIIRNAEMIKYVHFADSNRYYPGKGHLDFTKIVEALHTADYNAWCAVEILPKPSPDIAAKEAVNFLLPFFS